MLQRSRDIHPCYVSGLSYQTFDTGGTPQHARGVNQHLFEGIRLDLKTNMDGGIERFK